jgi:TPR repeat protein
MYEEGKGVKQDDFKALKFYQKACDLNKRATPAII